MKKIFRFVPLLLVFLIISCGAPRAQDILSHERVIGAHTVAFSIDGRSFTARLSREESGALRLEFVSPESLSGLCVTKEGERLSVAHEGVTEQPDALLAESSAVLGVFDCFSLSERVEQGELSFRSSEEDRAIFSDGTREYELRFSPDGVLESIRRRFPDGETLVIEISDKR